MRTLLFSLTLAALSIGATQAQTTYGIKTGINLAKVSNLDHQKFNPSYFVTGFVDFPFSNQFSIQPGISLQGKGSTVETTVKPGDASPAGDYKSTLNTMSVEAPINAIYYIPTGSGKTFLSAGPYLGYTISGKVKESRPDGKETRDISFSGSDKNMNRLDAGLNFGVGYKLYNGFLIQAGYGLGLNDLNASKSSKANSNRTLNFGIGFQW